MDKGKPYYDIHFRINNTNHMSVFCPLRNKHIKKAIKQLKEMKAALDKIDKTVELIVSIK